MADKWSPKDPGDERDYKFNWAEFLPEGEVITDYTLVIPDELTQIDDSNTDTEVIVRVGGGSVGDILELNCTIITTTGQKFNMDGILKIQQRVVKGQGVR